MMQRIFKADAARTGTDPNVGVRRRASHVNVIRGLLPFAWPAGRSDLRLRVVVALVLLVIAKLVTVAVPLAYKAAIDWLAAAAKAPGATGIAARDAATAIVLMILAYGAGRFLMSALTQVRDVLFTQVTANAARQLTTRTFEHLHRLSLRFHIERRTGGLNRVVQRGTNAVELIVRMGALNMLPTLIELVLIMALLVYVFGAMLALIVLAMVAAYIWFSIAASEWRLGIRRELNESDNEASTKAVDSLLNFETVKYFGNETLEARRFDASMARYEKASIRTYFSLGVLNGGQALIFTLGLVAVMIVAARGVLAGTHTVGDFVLVNALLIQLYVPLNIMGMIYREIRQGLVDLETMFALLDEAPEVVDGADARPLTVSDGIVRFEHVQFGYSADRPILKDLSFEVGAGRMVAIVGPSGAGKSTISRLLFRFYETTGGRVTIDGQDIREVTQESLRAAIGIVPQDTVLFNDTILYNIRYGRPEASDEEVHAAARMAQIDGFIRSLPDGYKSMVGERGLKLSGGEKQRVAIARTILKGPPILVLDEATSALDSHTEREIQTALEGVARDRTTLVIAHRLSTIIGADLIIVLDGGRIVEQGRHAELVATGGLYASMWARQREAEVARAKLAEALEQEAEVAGRTSEPGLAKPTL
ncbi:MAG: ABC transporter ATP-binding protein/permease [Hyphomicrobiaceae bacterium]